MIYYYYVHRFFAGAVFAQDIFFLIMIYYYYVHRFFAGAVFALCQKRPNPCQKRPNSVHRFFAGAVFAQDILAPYDYFWRMDSDSYIIGPMAIDPLEKFEASSASYAFLVDSLREQEGPQPLN
jgi:hypothetical protein